MFFYNICMSSKILWPISGFLFFLALLLAFNSNIKKQVYSYFNHKPRKILTTLTANLINNGEEYKILKVEDGPQLFIEVYLYNSKARRLMKIDKKQLKHRRDGFYKFEKEATNLFTADLNNDGILEIIAPTYTQELKPFLNILFLNPETKKLEWSAVNQLGY